MKLDLAFALENAGWPALLVDEASTICRVNPAAVKVFGATLAGQSPLLSAIWCPENGGTAEQFLAHWERAPAASVPLKFRAKGGHDLGFLASICSFAKDGQKYFVMQLFPDTDTREAKAHNGETTHKQKLDCALQLARTVALDINNALTGVLGHTSLMLSQIEPNHPSRHALGQVEKSALKAAAITNELAAFSRHEKVEREQSARNVNAIVQRSVQWAQQQLGLETVRWNLQLEPQPFATKADESRMQQAFNNIVQNAVESLTGSGSVTIHTRNLELHERTQDRNVQLAAGSYVCVEFTDSGCGIEPHTLSRIFEPFFTTKQGAHRGLGLAMVYGIVTNHGGGIAVSSQPGSGTSVRVYLPAENKIALPKGPAQGDLHGTETILVVDDEEVLLDLLQTILTAYGYRVLSANNGQKAVQILEQQDSPIHLLITDLAMPIMNGVELMEHVRQLSPETRILATSGYRWPGQTEDAAFLPKPFTCVELLQKVRDVLGDHGQQINLAEL